MHIYDLMLYIFPPSHERFHSFNTEAALITHHSDGVDVGQLRQELPTTEGELSVGLEELLPGETEEGGEEVRKKVSTGLFGERDTRARHMDNTLSHWTG